MKRLFSNLARWLKSFFVGQPTPAGHEAPPPEWETIRQSHPPQHWLDLAKSSAPLLQFSRESGTQDAVPQTKRDVRRSAPSPAGKEIPRLVVPANNGSTRSRRPEFAAKFSVLEDRDMQQKKTTRVRDLLSRLLKPLSLQSPGEDETSSTTEPTQTSHSTDVSQRTPAQPAEWTKNQAQRSARPLEVDEPHGSQSEPATFSENHPLGDEPRSIHLRVPDSVRPHRPKAEYAIGLSSPLSQRPAIPAENRWPRLNQENRERVSFSGSEATEAAPQKTFTETVLAMVADLWPELPDDSNAHERHPRSMIRTAQRAQQLKQEQRGF